MGDVFISYKQDERDRMRPIADGLRAMGVDVWFDERLQPDRSFTEEIHQVMNGCKAQIVCWSPAAVASEWVRGEAEVARQRGVLVAVIMEPCTLLPPFNMHHAESLAGWSGDPKHAGWRKLCDVIGRKVDRLGLGELAALQGSTDSAAWKKWAQKFPHDPSAEEAWVKAEEFEIAGARERMARDRETARVSAENERRRATEEAQRRRDAPPPPPVTQAAPSKPAGNSKTGLLIGGAIAAAALIVAGFFVVPQLLPSAATGVSANSEEIGDAVVEAPAATPDVAQTPTNTSAEPQATAAPAQQHAASANPAQARTALDRISAREWSMSSDRELMLRVISASSLASLRAASDAGDPRAQVLLGVAQDQFGDDPLPRDRAEAIRLWRLAAGQGNARAQLHMGLSIWCYGCSGITRTQAIEAERWFKGAADQGIAPAQMHLGKLYASSFLRAPDYQEAARYFRMAAEQGYAWGQYEIGQAYLAGTGVERDRDEGVRWLRLAARQDRIANISAGMAQSTLTNMNETW